MNILASYSWLKEYCQTTVSPEDFARELSLKSMSVESIERLGSKFDRMVVGVVQEISTHPKADRLRIAKTDIGGTVASIVCGGTNLTAQQKVVVALPGAKVKWHGEGDLVELQETEIRGVKSAGMICAAAEIGFEKLPAGEKDIWDITSWTDAPAGTPIAEALGLNDVMLDVEVTTNRPDCMGIVGLAREASTAVSAPFELPTLPKINAPKNTLPLKVTVDDQKLCPRFMAVIITGIKVGPSPAWLQKKLLLAGHRPINNIVDITNYVLHEYGRPLHAFDYNAIANHEIIVRRARAGESIVALDGKTYDLTSKNLVIADSEKPMAIAGVMGGEVSGTHQDTVTIVFESAAFDPVSIRRTSRALNLQSDSQLIFEKGISTETNVIGLQRAVELTLAIAGGEVASEVFDVRAKSYQAKMYPVRYKKIRSRIGVDISNERIDEILSSLGFILEKEGVKTIATVPFWRDHDIETEVDLTEEVARMYGYHNMPLQLPAAVPPPANDDRSLVWETKIKRALASIGYSEFFGYSLLDARDLERYGISPQHTVTVKNPLSQDLVHMRPTLMPSFLHSIEQNQSATSSAKVFELSRVYIPSETSVLPAEHLQLVCGVYGNQDVENALREVKFALEYVAQTAGLTLSLERVTDDAHWHAGRSARIVASGIGEVGMLGQVASGDQAAFDITHEVFAFVLDIEKCVPHFKNAPVYTPVPAFPTVTRDIAYLVGAQVQYADLAATARVAHACVRAIGYVETYTGQGIAPNQKSVTLSFTLGAADHTLTTSEIDDITCTISAALEKECGAKVR